ncbi:MAG: hypothetical protein ACOH18_03215 [Candidatus Saccharimonadaceae bacterium]
MDAGGLTSKARVSPQILGKRGSRLVFDASSVPTQVDPASKLTLFGIESVFTDNSVVFLGFGKPNTFLVVPRSATSEKGPGWDKFAAFMFWRKKSYVANTKGRVQAGILFELRDLPADTVEQLRVEMHKHSDTRGPSCAHTNARVLDGVGFTSGGRRLVHILRPSKLAGVIWSNGLELNSKPVDLRIVQTGARVSDHFLSVWRKEVTSMFRSVAKKFHKADHTPAPVFEPSPQSDLADSKWQGDKRMAVGISRPSYLGAHLSFVLGEHIIYHTWPKDVLNAPELSTPLKSFPGKLSTVSKVKKYVLFSRPSIWFIRRHLAATTERYDGLPSGVIVDMLRISETSDHETAFKYNLVMTPDEIRITTLENRNGRDISKLNWILSKHVLVSGYHPDVRYACEIWRCIDENGESVIYMNSDSGTYKPSSERKAPAAEFISKTYDVRVVTV